VHALTPRAIRCEMGIPEERACRRAHVSRETLRKYERGEFIPTRTKRQRLDAMYGGWRAELAWSVEVGHTAAEDDEMSPRDLPGQPPESGIVLAADRAA
jgi:predicted transcriptional regulator